MAAKQWLNELTHERVFSATCPDPKAVFFRHVYDAPEAGAAKRSATDPRVGRAKNDTIHREWSEAPLWTALDACDSAWHRPAEQERQKGAAAACPYCGMGAGDDLARRKAAGEPLTDSEKKGKG